MYKASIIIPVYNAENMLRRCVESIVLGQERNVQVILVEDRSKDNSWNVCLELAQEFPQVQCIQNEKNSGVSFTRNQGLAAAQGEYILFVDSDDWISERYTKTLLALAQAHSDTLPICGQHFIDKVHGANRDYTWSDEPGAVTLVEAPQFFDLCDRFLMQQLWNKIFRRDIIEQHHIRFDETQSMGEDFQFVLDYLEASGIRQCAVINEPLYYYIRWGNTSLMSKFGLVENTDEYNRLQKLLRICGEDDEQNRQRYQTALDSLKLNYVYQGMRAAGFDRGQKLDFIEKIMGDGKAQTYYNEQSKLIVKEKAAQLLTKAHQLPNRVRGRLQREKNALLIRKMRKHLHTEKISIISQNCIGGVFYHDMGLQFQSPTINLYFEAPDFIRFVERLDHYLSLTPEMFWLETYPIGRLEDVTIHFMHYDTCKQALDAWERRKQRIDRDRLLLLCTDMENFTDDCFLRWQKLPYPKLLFTANPAYAQDPDSVYFAQYAKEGKVGDLISTRAYDRKNTLILKTNQIGGKTK